MIILGKVQKLTLLVVCMQLSTLNFATAFVYWIDYAFSFHDASFAWRVPCIMQVIFLFPMLLLVWILPETPRWLAAHDRQDESLAVLRRVKAGKMTDAEIVQLHHDIVKTVAIETELGAGTWKDCIKSDALHSRRRLLIACSIQIFQQLGGKYDPSRAISALGRPWYRSTPDHY